MICSRFHSLILSYLLRQKLYVLSYSNKITNVIDDLNLVDTYYTLNSLNELDFIQLRDFNDVNFNNTILENAENQFKALDDLLLKNETDENVNVIIPARNEEKTIPIIFLKTRKTNFNSSCSIL